MVETFGEAVRRLRGVRGSMSLRELARRAHLDPGHLSRIESGTRTPTPAVAGALDKALAAEGALATRPADRVEAPTLTRDGWRRDDAESLAAALVAETPEVGNAVRLAHEWLITEPPQLYEMRAGRRIGVVAVERIEQRVHQLRILDDHVGGLETYEMVTGELSATLALLREAAYTEQVSGRLLTTVSELCQLAGWVTADAGRGAEAQRLYLTGLRAAHAAGDCSGAANNLSSLAYQIANSGDPRDAVTLAASAVCGANGSVSATTQALLHDRLAWAHARAGEASGSDRALGLVEEEYARRRPEDDPRWVYWLDAGEIAVMAGRCWTQLRRPLRAVPVLERALAGYAPDSARESALYLTWLAEAYLQANEVERAVLKASRALVLARRARSARIDDRMAELRGMLLVHRGTGAVDAFEELYRDV
jgi:transcriptional regulator with XRE-family HTH domain